MSRKSGYGLQAIPSRYINLTLCFYWFTGNLNSPFFPPLHLRSVRPSGELGHSTVPIIRLQSLTKLGFQITHSVDTSVTYNIWRDNLNSYRWCNVYNRHRNRVRSSLLASLQNASGWLIHCYLLTFLHLLKCGERCSWPFLSYRWIDLIQWFLT